MPLHDKKLRVSDWGFLSDTVEGRLPNWKGSLLSIGGRYTLVNSVLTAIPMFMMSLYRMPVTVRKKLDRIRMRFFWQGTSLKKKYAMVSWKQICLPKNSGGLGILDLDVMNISLLLKWWWRLKDPNYTSIWKQIVQVKYAKNTPKSKFSAIWKEIYKIASIGEIGCTMSVGNGQDIRFWLDTWFGDFSLKSRFPDLFEISLEPDITLIEVVQSPENGLRFCRQLTGMLWVDFNSLLNIIQSITLTPENDSICWKWSADGKFATHSAYEWLIFRGVTQPNNEIWWPVPIPLKIQIFMWLVCKSRIVTRDNMAKRGWGGELKCSFCPDSESAIHLILHCSIAKQIWFYMGECQNMIHIWVSFDDVFDYVHSLNGSEKYAFLVVFSAVCWVIWKTRNDCTFRSVTIPSIRNMILLTCSLVHWWTGLARGEVQKLVNRWLPLDFDVIPLQVVQPQLLLTDAVM